MSLIGKHRRRFGGAASGPINLVTNGDFATGDLTGWIDINSYWTVSGGRAVHAPTSDFNMLLSDGIPAPGQEMRIRFSVYNISTTADPFSGLRVQFRDASQNTISLDGDLWGAANNDIIPIRSNGNYDRTATVIPDAVYVGFSRNLLYDVAGFEIDNVIIEQV
jgi:hypothetical protein